MMVLTEATSTTTKEGDKFSIPSYHSKPNECVLPLPSNMYGICKIVIYIFLLASYVDGKPINESKKPIPIPRTDVDIESCSATSYIVKYREVLITTDGEGCPTGTSYLCGYDQTGRVIEICQEYMECTPGTTHGFVINLEDRTVVTKCLPCKDGWFEPEYTNSSRSSLLLGCTYKHKLARNISNNLILFEDGSASRATRWYCDIENGYYEEGGTTFCDDVPTKPCNCVWKACSSGHLLRPDGACILCQRDQKLDPHDDFRCKRVEEFGVPNSATPSSSSGQVSEDEVNKAAITTPTVVGVLLGVLVLIGCCIKRCRARSTAETSETAEMKTIAAHGTEVSMTTSDSGFETQDPASADEDSRRLLVETGDVPETDGKGIAKVNILQMQEATLHDASINGDCMSGVTRENPQGRTSSSENTAECDTSASRNSNRINISGSHDIGSIVHQNTGYIKVYKNCTFHRNAPPPPYSESDNTLPAQRMNNLNPGSEGTPSGHGSTDDNFPGSESSDVETLSHRMAPLKSNNDGRQSDNRLPIQRMDILKPGDERRPGGQGSTDDDNFPECDSSDNGPSAQRLERLKSCDNGRHSGQYGESDPVLHESDGYNQTHPKQVVGKASQT